MYFYCNGTRLLCWAIKRDTEYLWSPHPFPVLTTHFQPQSISLSQLSFQHRIDRFFCAEKESRFHHLLCDEAIDLVPQQYHPPTRNWHLVSINTKAGPLNRAQLPPKVNIAADQTRVGPSFTPNL